MANHQFIEIYMQFRDPLQSCQALRVGYWTGNRCIDRTVEAPKKPSGRQIDTHTEAQIHTHTHRGIHTGMQTGTHIPKHTHTSTSTSTRTHTHKLYIKLYYSYLPFTGHKGDHEVS